MSQSQAPVIPVDSQGQRVMIRVAILVDKLDAGGAERHALSILTGLDSGRYDVSLVRLKPGGLLEPQLPASLRDPRFCVEVARRFDWAAAGRLQRLFESEDIDVVVATNPYATLYALLAAHGSRKGRPQVVSTFHSTDLPGLKNRLQMYFYRAVFPFVDALVYVCENQRQYWRRRALRARKDIVIHNGIDTTRFSEPIPSEIVAKIRRQSGWSDETYVVGVCAALRPEKAHLDLVQAIGRLNQGGRRSALLIIGDGPERPRIERLVEELGIGGAVRITGFQPDVRPFIAACDVMALTSRSETFSLAVLEAMAAAKPVVLTRTGGAPEQITHGKTGYLFTPGNIPELAECLALLEERDRRVAMGANALEDVRDRFELALMMHRYQELIDAMKTPSA